MKKHYDFDKVIDRSCTCSVKNDWRLSDQSLEMWVADMDFPVCDEIILAAKKRLDHPIFGYSYVPDSLYEAFIGWHQRQHQVTYEKDRILLCHTVVSAISLTLMALTKKGDVVTVLSPAYMNFPPAILEIGRTILTSPLINEDNRYRIDFDSLERCLSQSQVLLLCSPHNPVGRVFTRGELMEILRLANQYDTLVISDEIHSDIIMTTSPQEHIPFFSLNESAKNRTITLLSATKTFNIAQAGFAFLVAHNQNHFESIRTTMDSLHLGGMNLLATTMVEAAFRHGDAWLSQVKEYVLANYEGMKKYIEMTMPKILVLPMEGMYLAWLDCRDLGMDVATFFEKKAQIHGDDGDLFGLGGTGYYRINLASSKKIVAMMLDRMKQVYDEIIGG